MPSDVGRRRCLISELGLHTFGDVTADAAGALLPQAQVIRDVVAEGVLADQVGLDFFGVGEHHREDFAVSAPDVVLAAIAGQTRTIRLGSAVTVLSSDDPVRVFERFSTLDAVSGGRAEVILGRGSFIESFPLFGYALDDYEQLFEEKVQLFAELLEGRARHVVGRDAGRAARSEGLPAARVRRAAHVDRRGRHARSRWCAPRTTASRSCWRSSAGSPCASRPSSTCTSAPSREFGQDTPPVGVHSHGYVARTDSQALDESWPHYAEMHAKIGRERGWPPMSREQYEAGAGPDGALFVGSPETVAAKIVKVARGLGLSRFDMKYSIGSLPHARLMTSIELYGTEVAPLVRAELAA